MRILMEPGAADGGATGQSPEQPVAQGAAHAASKGPDTVPIPVAQLQTLLALQQQVATLQAEQRKAIEEEQRKAIEARVQKGQAEEAVKLLREQTAKDIAEREEKMQATEMRARNYARDRELMAALANEDLVPGAADDLMELLRKGIDAHPEGDGYTVRTDRFESAADYVKAALKKPGRDHYLRAKHQGGSGSTGASQTTPTPSDTESRAPLGETASFYAKKFGSKGTPSQSMFDPNRKLG